MVDLEDIQIQGFLDRSPFQAVDLAGVLELGEREALITCPKCASSCHGCWLCPDSAWGAEEYSLPKSALQNRFPLGLTAATSPILCQFSSFLIVHSTSLVFM